MWRVVGNERVARAKRFGPSLRSDEVVKAEARFTATEPESLRDFGLSESQKPQKVKNSVKCSTVPLLLVHLSRGSAPTTCGKPRTMHQNVRAYIL